jgi:hypothetical protein
VLETEFSYNRTLEVADLQTKGMGGGTATVTTPATFIPGQSYTVIESAGHFTTTTAEGHGRLTITVSLGTDNTTNTEVTNS